MKSAIAHQDESGIVGHLAPFVKIESQRMGALHPGEARGDFRREHAESAEGAIHVKPEMLGGREVGEGGEVVDRADIHGACGADEQEGHEPGGAVGSDGAAQCSEVNAVVSVHGDEAEGVAAQARIIHGARDAAVDRGGGIADESPAVGAEACLAHRSAERRAAGHEHGNEIRQGSAGDEEAGGFLRETENAARPGDDLTFDFDGRVVPATTIGVEASRQHLRKHADDRAAAMHPAHEAGMDITRGERQDEIQEVAVNLREFGRGMRHRGAEDGADMLVHGSPDGTIADVFDVVEDIVEHAVTLEAQRLPVGGIEAGGRGLRSGPGGIRVDAHQWILLEIACVMRRAARFRAFGARFDLCAEARAAAVRLLP